MTFYPHYMSLSQGHVYPLHHCMWVAPWGFMPSLPHELAWHAPATIPGLHDSEFDMNHQMAHINMGSEGSGMMT